jgi:hypothetical protein
VFFLFFVFSQMADCHDRVMKDHTGPREPHDLSDLFPHSLVITMDLTVAAEGFGLHKRTVITALTGIRIQSGAIGAKAFVAVIFMAEDRDHQRDGFFFSLSFGFDIISSFSHDPRNIRCPQCPWWTFGETQV